MFKPQFTNKPQNMQKGYMLFFCKHVWEVRDKRSPGYSHEMEYKIRGDTFNVLYVLTDVSEDQNTQELKGSIDFKGKLHQQSPL